MLLSAAVVSKSEDARAGGRVVERDRRDIAAAATNATFSRRGLMEFMMSVFSLESNQLQNKAISPTKTPIANPNDEEEDDLAGNNVNKSTFLRIAKRPTMHIGFHYPEIAHEFGTPWNVSIFIGEDEHRFWKDQVQYTNGINVEETLMLKENILLTTRLLLFNAFIQDEPDITHQIGRLQKQTPAMFLHLITRTDRTKNETVLSVEEDNWYQKIQVSRRVKSAYMKAHHPYLPVRLLAQDMNHVFRNALREAYKRDYSIYGIVDLDTYVFHWCLRLSFWNP